MMNSKVAQLFVHQFIFLVIFLSFLCFSLETEKISSGVLIKDPESIVSQKQVFKLGFFTPENTTNRYLGIFYAFSEETVVWVANRDNPLHDSSGTVVISEDGNLMLINGSNQTVWSTNIAPTTPINATSVQIRDTGNLVLRNDGTTIWESFSHPSNCFLPTMKLNHNINTGKKMMLSSWANMSDPRIGSFTAGIEALNIPQILIWNNNGRPHWRSGQWNGVIFNGIKDMYDPVLDGRFNVVNEYDVNFYLTIPEGKSFMKLCLNSSGSIVRTLWDDQKKNWFEAWRAPENECDIYGRCGRYGSCNTQDSPICSCMRGFEPVKKDEWERGNWSGGCQRKNQFACNRGEGGNGDGFLRLPFMKLPDFAEPFPGRGEDECRSRCSRNCSCIAYAHDPNIGCLSWSNFLIDAQELNSVGVDLHIRLSASELDNHKDRKLYVIVPVVVGFISVSIFVFVAWCRMVKIKGDKTKDRRLIDAGQMLSTDSTAILLKDELEIVNIEELPLFTFATLANATHQFHENNLLGRGGFGPVYKGKLANGKEIAVKRLSEASRQGMQEFKNEVIVISKLQHRNLVRLLGCCVENEEKMLIYEYMPNKSLDLCLFDPTHPSQKVLDWAKRFSIIEGTGRGLLYLHRDSRLRIIHRDLKPSNVLLDEDWNPKISDFGIARMFGGSQDHADTARVVGTYGYMAPEYALEGRFSEKSDVYSFGVLMLEMVKGKKNTHYYNHEWCLSLLGCAWKLWSKDNGLGFADESIASSNIKEDILRCIQIALLCVQEVPRDRPTIQTVLSMLSREIVDLPPPEQPVFAEKWNGGLTQAASQVGHSINELTLTVLHGR